jgi:hypothetical protein
MLVMSSHVRIISVTAWALYQRWLPGSMKDVFNVVVLVEESKRLNVEQKKEAPS